MACAGEMSSTPGIHRLRSLLALMLLTAGCTAAPARGAAAPPGGPPETHSAEEARSLPRYLTVVLEADGRATLDGEALADGALGERAQAARARAEAEGVVLFADGSVEPGRIGSVFQELVAAGWTHVRFARRVPVAAAPDAVEPAPVPVPVAAAAPEPPPSAEPSRSGDAPEPAVRIANIGLHIGGGPNDEESRRRIQERIEPHFGEFRRCYTHIAESRRRGSFGVDLRVGSRGGKGRVTESRTKLPDPAFHRCVVEVFERIELPPPPSGLPTVISYSLLFAPEG